MSIRKKLSLPAKLILGILALSVIGLSLMVVIVNTAVHNAIYENVLELAERNKYIYALEIEDWFDDAANTLHSISSALRAVDSMGCYSRVIVQFMQDNDFIENIFIGFPSGYAITSLAGGPWYSPEIVGTPWFISAEYAGGCLIITDTYVSPLTNTVAISFAQWVSCIGDDGASVGISISIELAIDIARRLSETTGGYHMLIGANNEIIHHPSFVLAAMNGDSHTLLDITNGEFFIDVIAEGNTVTPFYDAKIGSAYFIFSPLHTPKWTFAAVLPDSITRNPVRHSVAYITSAFSILLAVLFFVIMLVIWRFTRRMEDSRNAIARLQSILDASPMLCTTFDGDGNVLDVNNAAFEFFEIGNKREYIRDFYRFSPVTQQSGINSKEVISSNLQEAINTGRAQEITYYEYQTKSGEPRPCNIVLIPLEIAGETKVVVYVRDLRAYAKIERLEREEREKSIAAEVAEASNRAKSRFLAGMSHEIRTPIAAVMGIAEIELRNPMISPHFEEAFAKIHASSKSLLGIINDILDISKIEAGKMELIIKDYDTPSIITDAAHLFAANIHDKDIEFKIFISEELPVSLSGDVLRIEQIINNLLSNAFKYTVAGSVKMYITHETDENDPSSVTLVISVEDTGMGMSDEQIKTLFNEYTQYHSNKITGTGLGMNIVNSLVTMMDAKIEVKSRLNKGTRVTVKIPQKVAKPEPLGKETAQKLQQFKMVSTDALKRFKTVPERMPYGKVLVVDDIEANIYVSEGLLSYYELKVETCNSGEKALNLIEQGKTYDIIFMDQTMPGLSGTETMQAMRKNGYTGTIIVLTANALIGQAEEYISAGFDGFLSKPIQTELLNTILVKHIKAKQPPEILRDISNYQESEELQKKLRTNFAKSQKHTHKNILAALETGDYKTAHRLAHSLKGLAALIKENDLSAMALQLERQLSEKQTPSPEDLTNLKEKLKTVLATLPVTEEKNEKALRLLETLAPLLASKNIESQSHIEALKTIPEAAILVKQIEDFEFSAAAKSLQVLQEIFDA